MVPALGVVDRWGLLCSRWACYLLWEGGMSRMGAYVQELQERRPDDGFDELAWLPEPADQEQKKVSLPPVSADVFKESQNGFCSK